VDNDYELYDENILVLFDTLIDDTKAYYCLFHNKCDIDDE
jgi:hypothetical protein